MQRLFVLCMLSKLLWVSVSGSRLTSFIKHYEPVYYKTVTDNSRFSRATERQADIKFYAFDRLFKLHLESDLGIFSKDAVVESNDGQILNVDRYNTFTGTLKGDVDSYIDGIITREGIFEGSIRTADDIYVLEQSQQYFNSAVPFHSVIYKYSDVHMKPTWPDTLYEGKNMHKRLHQLQKNLTRSGIFHKSSKGPSWRRSSDYDPSYVTCPIAVHVDHLFYASHDSNMDKVINKIKRYMSSLNGIFKPIDFDEDARADGVNFVIKRLKIFPDNSRDDYPYDANFGVERFLSLFSTVNNFDEFCLGYMFTHRDFEQGTLGLAWVGSESGAGGACQKNAKYHGVKKSLNTGIVSTLNYGDTVPFMVSQYTFAHEVGHNLGSKHDDTYDSCTPGGKDGNYLMFSRANTGIRKNNGKFSSCSIVAMAEYMSEKARAPGKCFLQSTSGFCGNAVVEEEEECDCGWTEECTDTCCHPMTDGNNAKACTLKANKICSPTKGSCCKSDCTYRPKNAICAKVTDCTDEATCAGNTAVCPEPGHKNKHGKCIDKSDRKKACIAGECVGSICLSYQLEPCQCAPETNDNPWSDKKLCHLCCKPANGKCRSSFNIPAMKEGKSNRTMYPGEACYNNHGYCDVFDICREVDPTGPLNTLRMMFLKMADVTSIKAWLIKNWYFVVTGGVLFIIAMSFFIKYCSPTVPSDLYHHHHHHDHHHDRRHSQGTRKHGHRTVAPLPKR